MVPMVDRAKLAELKRLKREMRRIMAETGVEDDPTGELDPTEEAAEGEVDLSPSAHVDHDAADVTPEEDELMRLKKRYFKPEPRKSRPGSGMVSISMETKKAPSGMSGGMGHKRPKAY